MNTERVGDLDMAAVGVPDVEPGAVYVLREGKHGDRFHREIETLHVISKHAGGEIRGYILPEGEASWLLRTPCSPMEWPEIDRAVANLIGAAVNGATPAARQRELPLVGAAS